MYILRVVKAQLSSHLVLKVLLLITLMMPALLVAKPRTFFSVTATDTDFDGVMDSVDNCVNRPNPDQTDSGGVNTLVPDGVGDACQCGDVNNNGLVDNTDAILIKRYVLGLPPGVDVEKCNVNTGEMCDNSDAVFIQRALLGMPPGLLQACSAATELKIHSTFGATEWDSSDAVFTIESIYIWDTSIFE